ALRPPADRRRTKAISGRVGLVFGWSSGLGGSFSLQRPPQGGTPTKTKPSFSELWRFSVPRRRNSAKMNSGRAFLLEDPPRRQPNGGFSNRENAHPPGGVADGRRNPDRSDRAGRRGRHH